MLSQFFEKKESEVRFFFSLLIGLSLLVVSSYVLGARVEREDFSTPTLTAMGEFPAVEIEAKSAYVYDARTKEVIFAKNENQRLPLASLTKVMAALVAEELSPSYSTVTVTQEALVTEGDSGLRPGERWSLRDLLDFSLVSSSNDGIRAIALTLGAMSKTDLTEEQIIDDFVREMNKKAQELDLRNTYFWNETGLDESDVKGGAYGTARDMALLLEFILARQPELMEATRDSQSMVLSLDNLEHLARNTNQLAPEIPGLLASKTGFTSTAGGNLVFAFDPELGRPIIISVLGSSAAGRFTDARILVDATLEYLSGEQQ